MVASNIGSFTSDSMSSIFSQAFGALSAFTIPSFDYAVRQPDPYVGRFSSHAIGSYVQDSWRIHPRLSANLGIRYDFFSMPKEAKNNIWNFDPTANGLVQAGSTSVVDPFGNACQSGGPVLDAAIYPAAKYQYGWGCSPTGSGRLPNAKIYDLAPRAGLAWDVFGNGSTVFRGGAALMFDQQPISYAEQLIYNRPSTLNVNNPSLIYGQQFFQYYVSPTDGKYHFSCFQCGLGNTSLNAGYFTNPSVQNVQNRSFPNINVLQGASSPQAVYALDTQESGSPYTVQINAGVQQRLSNKLAMELAYIQTTGDALPVVSNTGFNNEWFCTANPPKRDASGNITTPGCDGVSPVFSLTNQAPLVHGAPASRGVPRPHPERHLCLLGFARQRLEFDFPADSGNPHERDLRHPEPGSRRAVWNRRLHLAGGRRSRSRRHPRLGQRRADDHRRQPGAGQPLHHPAGSLQLPA
jgi:hypothetical protein